MYNRDIITILLRDHDFSKLQSGTEDKIKQEFKRIFGKPLPDQEPEETPMNTTVNTTQIDTKSKNVTVDVEVFKEQEIDSPQVGKGIDFGRKKEVKIGPNLPIEFDEHLKELDHEKCTYEDYPDLSLTREDRLRL